MKPETKPQYSVRRNLVLIFILVTLIILFFASVIHVISGYTNANEEKAEHNYAVMKQMEEIRSGLAQSETVVEGYLPAPVDSVKRELQQLHVSISKSVSLSGNIAEDLSQKKQILQLSSLLQQNMELQLQKINLQSASFNNKTLQQADERRKNITKLINQKILLITKGEQELLAQQRESDNNAEERIIQIAIAGALLILLLIAVLLWHLNNENDRRKKAEQKMRDSEYKYRNLVEGPGIVTITTDLNGRFEFVSTKAKLLTGYSKQELQGQSFNKLVPEAWQQQVLENFEQQYRHRITEKILRFPIVTKAGIQKWVKLTALIISNENLPVGFQCTVKDITDDIEAEAKLKESEELVQTLLNNTREGFFMVDRDLHIRVMNLPAKKGMEVRTCRKVEVGMNFLSLLPEDVTEHASDNFKRVFNGEAIEFEVQYDTTRGVEWMSVSFSPVKELNEEITGAVIVTSDITSFKQNEKKISVADQKIRAMLSSIQEGLFMIAPDYSMIMINEAGKQIIQHTTGQQYTEGKNMLDFLTTDRKEVFQKRFEKVMDGNTETAEEYSETNEAGLWFQYTYLPVRNEHNMVIAVCITAKNITEQKLVDLAWEKIRAEREEYQFRLQSILDNTPLIMFIKDLNGRYLLINRSYREEFGFTEEEVIGKTDFDFETDDDAAIRYREADDKVIATLEHVQTDETVQMADGEHHLLIVKFPLFDRDNIVYGVGAIATDITERTQAREKLVEAKKKAESAELLQEQFLANMSHEIRTPLNGIIGMTDILQHTLLNSEQEEFVEIIRQSSDNLLMLINDILDLSKIKAGKLSIENIEFNLQTVLDQAVAPFRVKAKEKNIHLAVLADEFLPVRLIGDSLRLTQILSNLLSNAIKFTDEGQIKLTVKEVQQENEEIVICFSLADTGIGIPADKLDHVFGNFEQAAIETTRKYGGTGLGLSITKQLCELMGGSITINSEVGSGTTFHVSLPFKISTDSAVQSHSKPKEQVSYTDLSVKKILIAEDNEINQKVIMHILQRAGIITTIVNNGKEAVDLLEEGQQFDLVILDLQMPVMNGFQTATYIRKKLQLTLPVIAMTASALRNEKMRCFELGMNEYLTKPFVNADLFAVLRRFLLASPVAIKPAEAVADRKQGTELYNLSHLYEMDDQAYFCEVLQLFLETTPQLLEEIKEASLYENWEQVYKKAHKLKSSLGILQMNLMLGLITAIELQAKEQLHVERIPAGLKKATEMFDLIRPMIEAELMKATQLNSETIIS